VVFDYNNFHHHTRVATDRPLSPGPHVIELKVARTADGGGDFTFEIDGAAAGGGRIPKLLFMISSTGMDIGRSLSPVTDDYASPFAYSGKIAKVVFETPQAMPAGEVKATVRAEMTRQ
jgi:arylsulfatase